ncbi:MAG: hypothetical protein LBB90_01545, partial [Tannerella sp.]|nr:hypothetical protein [Tannerella sp.]
MKVTFHIAYWADAGKKLCIAGTIAERGEWPFTGAQEMHREENGRWRLQVTIPSSVRAISYRYLLVD